MITIVHGGQTGVDRGAHDGASDNHWHITGFMPSDGMGEDGLIPRYVAQFLERCPRSGYRARTEANIKIAHALLVIVPDAADPHSTPGTRLTLELAGKKRVRREVTDPRAVVTPLAAWILRMLDHHLTLPVPIGETVHTPFRLMIAGPRASKWAEGRAETVGILHRIKNEMYAMQSHAPAKASPL